MDATMAEQGEAPPQTDSTRSPEELFRYSAWVHVGRGAQECEDRETGSCHDAEHFHAWCRLPNQFQHQDIRERALAAKARRIRQLRDPETDAHVILEADMAELARDEPVLIDELVAKDWWKRHLQAMGDVEQDDAYEHIDKDRERLAELQAMPPDDRPADEYEELERHFERYGAAVDKRRTELEEPVRNAANDLDSEALLRQVREDRIVAEGSAAFMDSYAKWQWLAGTFTSDHPLTRARRFPAMEALEDTAPEVIEALRLTFGELETSLQRGQQGN